MKSSIHCDTDLKSEKNIYPYDLTKVMGFFNRIYNGILLRTFTYMYQAISYLTIFLLLEHSAL